MVDRVQYEEMARILEIVCFVVEKEKGKDGEGIDEQLDDIDEKGNVRVGQEYSVEKEVGIEIVVCIGYGGKQVKEEDGGIVEEGIWKYKEGKRQ